MTYMKHLEERNQQKVATCPSAAQVTMLRSSVYGMIFA